MLYKWVERFRQILECRKCYILVVTQVLVHCLHLPSGTEHPQARVYIPGNALVPVLQLTLKIGSLYSYKANLVIYYAKQKHLGCKKVRGQSEATCKQAGATKSFDIS